MGYTPARPGFSLAPWVGERAGVWGPAVVVTKCAQPLRPLPSWHVTCSHSRENTLMATKVRMLKLLQELRGFAAIANRQPQPRSPALLLAQMRPPVIQAVLPRRRLSITMVQPDNSDIPHPVKINHSKPEPAPPPSLPAA